MKGNEEEKILERVMKKLETEEYSRSVRMES